MNHAVSAFVTLLCVSVCFAQTAIRPIDPEAMGMRPSMGSTPDEAMKLQKDATAAFESAFGIPLPAKFRLSVPPVGWFTDKGELKQIRASAKLPRGEFRKRTVSKDWRETPIPNEYLTTMHLPSNVSKSYMTCYVGLVGGKAAYLFWSDYGESALLVLDY